MCKRLSLGVAAALCAVILLSAPVRSNAQSYSPIFAPQSTTPWRAWCVDGYGHLVPYCYIYLFTGAWTYTNAHFHTDSSQPYSTFSFPGDPPGTARTAAWAQSGPDGYLYFYMKGSIVGQAEFLCSQTGYGTTCSNFAVGYNDVYYNDHPEIWIRIGGSDTGGDTGHGTTAYNRYMRTYAAYGLYYATQAYLADHPGVNQFCTNDMALPFGGKFDTGNWTRWRSPHVEHDRGTAADVAGPGSGQCPVAHQVVASEFIQQCIRQGALAANSYNEGNHAHCNWASPSSYPH